MKIDEFQANYDLHDSLLESIKQEQDKLVLFIELCNWRQKNYRKNDLEMKGIKLVFNSVCQYSIDATTKQFDSDTILEFKYTKNDNKTSKIKIVTEDDGDIKIIQFYSTSIEVFDV